MSPPTPSPAPIRVLQIISGFALEGPLGGIERFVIELVQALPPDIEPVVCGLWDYGSASDEAWLHFLHERGIQAFVAAPWNAHSPYRAFRAAWQGTREVLAGQRVALIHSHCQFGDPLALMLRRPLQAQALLRTVHNEHEWLKRPERRLLLTQLAAPLAFDAELGVARAVANRLNRRPLARLLNKRARVMYNALNLERFQRPPAPEEVAALRRQIGLPDGALVIGSVGRLEPQKGYTFLLQAMEAVVARFPQAHLLLAGDGTLAGALREQAAASPVRNHLHLLGPVRGIERLYALLALYVSSSLWEGLPTVLLEAIAMGVPVVATRVSGSVELIEEGRSGRLAPPGDAGALAATLIAALGAPHQSREMARQARDVLAQFDIHRVAEQQAALYRELVQD